MIDPAEWVARLADDGEFMMAARGWTGGLLVRTPTGNSGFTVVDGQPSPAVATPGEGVIVLDMPTAVWDKMTAPVPPPFFNDISAALSQGVRRTAGEMVWWQYMPASQRAVELARTERPAPAPATAPPGVSPAGRYVLLDVADLTYRIYLEEAGRGIPLLLQHTAGSHGTQWRHLFEMDEITDRFRLIAYDLPFHGKSVPPTGSRWWEVPYQLEGGFLRAVVTGLVESLNLDAPVFMGCSVGGLLALDLAHKHPNLFRAVISLQGALNIDGSLDRLTGLWHPQVSNESKAKMMEGLMAPTSPYAYRKETTQTYAAGWPPVFLGDLAYYIDEFDLRHHANEIDTNQVGVHILTGDYDHSATVERGRAAHQAIAGSTWSVMPGLGHFPMSENPELFAAHLLPILDQIAKGDTHG